MGSISNYLKNGDYGIRDAAESVVEKKGSISSYLGRAEENLRRRDADLAASFGDWQKGVSDYFTNWDNDYNSRAGSYQDQASLDAYRSSNARTRSEYAAQASKYADYFNRNRDSYENVDDTLRWLANVKIGLEEQGKALDAEYAALADQNAAKDAQAKNASWNKFMGYSATNPFVSNNNLQSPLALIQNKNKNEALRQASEQVAKYSDLQKKNDYVEKSKYDKSIQPSSFFEDPDNYSLYQWMNADEKQRGVIERTLQDGDTITSFDQYKSVPENILKNYNYIVNTEGVAAGRKYLDSAYLTGEYSGDYTVGDAIGAGLGKGLGIQSLSEIANAIASGITGDYSDMVLYEKQLGEMQNTNKIGYEAGNIAGSVIKNVVLSSMFSGVGAAESEVVGMSAEELKTAKNIGNMAKTALTFGTSSAISNAGSVAIGETDIQEALTDVGSSALSGGIMGFASGIASTGIEKYLSSHKLMNQFGEYIRRVGSATAGAGARVAVNTAVKGGNPTSAFRRNYKKQFPDATEADVIKAYNDSMLQGAAIDFTVSFLYSVIESAIETPIATEKANKYIKDQIQDVFNRYNALSKLAKENGFLKGDQKTIDYLNGLIYTTQNIKSALNNMYIAGQQKTVNEINDSLDTLIALFGLQMNTINGESTIGIGNTDPEFASKVADAFQSAMNAGAVQPADNGFQAPSINRSPVPQADPLRSAAEQMVAANAAGNAAGQAATSNIAGSAAVPDISGNVPDVQDTKPIPKISEAISSLPAPDQEILNSARGLIKNSISRGEANQVMLDTFDALLARQIQKTRTIPADLDTYLFDYYSFYQAGKDGTDITNVANDGALGTKEMEAAYLAGQIEAETASGSDNLSNTRRALAIILGHERAGAVQRQSNNNDIVSESDSGYSANSFTSLFSELPDGRIKPNNVDDLSTEDWKLIQKAVKKLGYEVDSAKQAKEIYSRYVGIGGFNEEQSAAIKKAYGITEGKPSAVNPKREALARKTFGTTGDFREAGYLMRNGSMLDFSGKKNGGSAHMRAMDHREINSVFSDGEISEDETRYGNLSAYMNKFISEGNIRLMDGQGVTIGEMEPTAQQYSILKRFIDHVLDDEGYFYLDLSNDKGYTIESRDYEPSDGSARIIRDIKEYFKNGELPYRSELSQFLHERKGKNIDIDGQISIEEFEHILENKYEGADKQDIKTAAKATKGIIERIQNFQKKAAGTGALSGPARTVALGVTSEFVRTGYVDFGKLKLDSDPMKAAGQIAAYAMILRNPNFETFRVLYTKGDRIVASSASTTYNVDRCYAGIQKKDNFAYIANQMKKLGSDGYYLMHNHPSGNVNYSKEDSGVTYNYKKNLPGFKGHIIIDHNEYGLFAEDTTFTKNKIENGAAKDENKRIIDSPLLYRSITSPEDVADIAKEVVHNKDYSTVVYSGNAGIRAIQEVDNRFLQSKDFANYVKNRKLDFGSPDAFVITGNQTFSMLDNLYYSGQFTDIVYEGKDNDGKDEFYSMRLLGRQRRSGMYDKVNLHRVYEEAPDYHPKKTIDVYKLMRLKDGKLYPLFIDQASEVKLNTWYTADSPDLSVLKKMPSGTFLVDYENQTYESLEEYQDRNGLKHTVKPRPEDLDQASKEGKRWVKIEDTERAQKRFEGENRKYWNLGTTESEKDGKTTRKVEEYSMRPGWHAGSLPSMQQIPNTNADRTFVWVKGKIPADISYQEEAEMNPEKDIPTHIPTDGYYLKATNADKVKSQADKIGWYVAGAFKPERIMSYAEARDVIDQWNKEHPSDEPVQYDYDRLHGKDIDPETLELRSFVREDTKYDTGEMNPAVLTSMTMSQCKKMIESAFNANDIKAWGEYKTAEEWFAGENRDEIASTIENTFETVENYLNNLPELDDEYTVEEILDAYADGKLVGKAGVKPERVDVSKTGHVSTGRFYEPQAVKNAKEAYSVANQRITSNNRKEVIEARKDVLVFAHQEGAAAELGITQSELNKKLMQWGRYSNYALQTANKINDGVSADNQWAGIQNTSVLKEATITADDIKEMAKEVTGNATDYEVGYIGRTMLAIDTHIDWKWLSFHFAEGARVDNGKALGTYSTRDRAIEIANGYGRNLNTVSHEMGHALDNYIYAVLSGKPNMQVYMTENHNIDTDNEDVKRFVNNFRLFVSSLLESGDNKSAYTQRGTETFARFVARFVEWTEKTAGGHQYFGTTADWYKDNFKVSQFVEFAHLLQEFSAVTADMNTDISGAALSASDGSSGKTMMISGEDSDVGEERNGNAIKLVTPSFEELSRKETSVVDIGKADDSQTYLELKQRALKKAEANHWFDYPHHNEDTNIDIFLSKDSYTHAFSNLTSTSGPDTILAMEHAPELIKSAILFKVNDPKNSRKAEKSVLTFFGAVKSGMRKKPVKLTVKVYDSENVGMIPKNIREYYQNKEGVIRDNRLYDTNVLEVIGFEQIEEPDASAKVGEKTRADSTSDSVIKITDLMKLVKGEASKYLPDHNGTSDINSVFETRQFKKWFGNSKAINKDGTPRVLYHWTNSTFDTFDLSKSGSNQGKTHGDGIYLSTSKDAFSYAGKNLMELYASIRRPFEMEMTKKEAEKVYEKYAAPHHNDRFGLYKPHAISSLMSTTKVFDYLQEYADENGIKVSDILKDLGYDGVHDGPEWVAFDGNQVKSATDNIGTYSADTDNILREESSYSVRETSSYSTDRNIDTLQDLRRQLSDVLRDNAIMKKQIAEYEKQFKVTGSTFTDASMKKWVRSITKEYGDKIDLNVVESALKSAGEIYFNNRGMDPAELEGKVREALLPASGEIVKNASVPMDDSNQNNYKSLRQTLKAGIRLSEQDKHDIPDYNDWRKSNIGYVTVTDKGQPMDTLWSELQDEFGKDFFPDDITHPAEQLMYAVEALKDMNVIYGNPFQNADVEEAREFVENNLLASLYNGILKRTEPTFADKMEARIDAERQSVAKKVAEAVEANQKMNDRLIAHLKKQYKENTKMAVRAQRLQDMAEKERFSANEKLRRIVKRLRNKKLSPVNRARVDEYIKDIDAYSVGLTGAKLEDLRSLDDFVRDHGEIIFPDRVKKDIERLRMKHISDLTPEEVATLTEVLLSIETEINNQNKQIDAEDKRATFRQASQVMDDISKTKGTKAGLIRELDDAFIMETLSPERYLSRITGHVDNDPLVLAGHDLTKGEAKMQDHIMRASKIFDKWTEDTKLMRKWQGKHADEIEITGERAKGIGKVTVKITPAMRMALYMHSLNDDNMRHIQYGGIVIPDMKLYKAGKYDDAYSKGTTIRLTRADIRKIANGMTAEEMAFIHAAQSYYQGMSQDEINDVSVKLLGFDLAAEENYFPIHTDKDFRRNDFSGLQHDGTIEGLGSLKQRVTSTIPIVLDDITNTVNRSINDTAKYVGLAIPVRNMNNLLGVTSGDFVDIGRFKGDITVYAANDSILHEINKKWGTPAIEYLRQLMRGLQTGGKDMPIYEKLFRRVRSNYAGSVLMLNAGVALKQAASYPTAAAVLGWKPLIRAMRFDQFGKVDLDNIAKYTPVQWYRSRGFSTQEIGDIKASGINLPTWLNWIQLMDLLTTRKLWKASEFYVQDEFPDLKKGTDAYFETVAEVYNRVIWETQPNYSTMQRPGNLRSDNFFVQTLMMFKTQPFQNFNILYDSAANLKAKETQYLAAKDGGTQAERETAERALKMAKKDLFNALTSQFVSMVVFAGMTAAWNALRGKWDKYKDKEGNVSFWSVLGGLGKDVLGGAAGIIPFGSDLWEILSSWVFKDRYYGYSSVSESAIKDFLDTMASTGSAIIDGKMTPAKWKKLAKDMAQTLGIPAKNVANLINMILGWFGAEEVL